MGFGDGKLRNCKNCGEEFKHYFREEMCNPCKLPLDYAARVRRWKRRGRALDKLDYAREVVGRFFKEIEGTGFHFYDILDIKRKSEGYVWFPWQDPAFDRHGGPVRLNFTINRKRLRAQIHFTANSKRITNIEAKCKRRWFEARFATNGHIKTLDKRVWTAPNLECGCLSCEVAASLREMVGLTPDGKGAIFKL